MQRRGWCRELQGFLPPLRGGQEGRKGGVEGKQLQLQLIYLLFLLREENSEAGDPELLGRGPSWVVGSATGDTLDCGERIHLGAGLRSRAPRVPTKLGTLS